MGTLEAVALALAELGETHAEAPLLSALRVACEAHEDAEVRFSSPEMPNIPNPNPSSDLLFVNTC